MLNLSDRILSSIFIFLFLFPSLILSACDNFGTPLAGGNCLCPIGFSGSNCSTLVCENPIKIGTSRLPFSSTLSGNSGSQGCGKQCSNGFTGPNCNVCSSNQACSAILNPPSTTTTSTSSVAPSGLTSPLTVAGGSNSDVTCNQRAWTWTEGFLTCSVINPTLQFVFPGQTTLTFQKTVEPTYSLSSTFGSAGTTQAQLWYTPPGNSSTIQEQFYCKADTCLQSNSTNGGKASVDWDCQNLQCICKPGTEFCGGSPSLDLTKTINTLTGSLLISCLIGTNTCFFQQSVLQTLFGSSGLSLSGCNFGECVNQSTINLLTNRISPDDSSKGGTRLSIGVIIGLSVLGVVVLILMSLLIWACLNQRKARKGIIGGSHLDEKLSEGGVGVKWREVGYSLPSSSRTSKSLFSSKSKKSTEDDGRILLDGVSGEISGGRFLAILGPTGAGKSTFVDILAGRNKSGRISGVVDLILPHSSSHSNGNGNGNGGGGGGTTEIGSKKGKKVKIGYVDQHDVLPSTSTVREALLFAAQLKLPESINKAAKEARVFEIMTQLGLLDVADTIIGSSIKRGISGGERRRLSIGLELVAAPAILIADEPTSGLDSTSAMRVIQLLKSLSSAESGRPTTVIATVHQPSSQMFHSFDTVLVLGLGGRQVYFGSAQDANPFFAAQGKPCPSGWNPADHLLEIASVPQSQLTATNSLGYSDSRIKDPESLHSTSVEGIDQDAHLGMTSIELNPTSPTGSSNFDSAAESGRRSSKPVAGMLTQFEVLSGREFRNLKRDWSLIVMHNLVPVIVGLFVGGLYYQVNLTIGGFQSRIGSLFFLGSLLVFSSLSALTNFSTVRPLFLRERAGGYYSPIPWIFSRVAFDILPLRIVPTLIVASIVYWMVGLSPTADHFLKYLLILVELNIANTLWNFVLAASIDESSVAILLSSILNLAELVYAGFFVSLANIPPVLRWIQWLSPLKFALEALAVNEVNSGLMIVDELQGVPINVSASLIMETLFGFDPSAYWRDVLVLFGFAAGFFIILMGIVVFRLKEMR